MTNGCAPSQPKNNLSETSFFVPRGDHYELRWFTPRCEVKLCGHATLASAWVILRMLEPERDSVRFETRFTGTLTVRREDDLLAMDFPALPPWRSVNPPTALIGGLENSGAKAPTEVMHIQQRSRDFRSEHTHTTLVN
jgi:predicted PhzF superfamily epimerase YddE/YHI9